MYQELLVGQHPFRNLNARQMASPKLRGQPDLALLPAPDRSVIVHALAADPQRRFRSCVEFVLALEEATRQVEHGAVTIPVAAPPSAPGVARPGPVPPLSQPDWKFALEELVYAAGRGHLVCSQGQVHFRITHGHSIEHRSWARLAPGMARLKLAGFQEHWKAETVSRTDSSWRLDIRTKSSFMERCLGRTPGLQLEVVLGTPSDPAASRTPLRVTIEPVDCGRGRAEHVLAEFGPAILTSLQSYLNFQGDRAMQERYPLHQLLQVEVPGTGVSVAGRTRDIGLAGLAFTSPVALEPGPVTATTNRWASAATAQIPARVRDCREAEGQFEIELEFGT
ncbi:MAG: hypothetical protein U0797_03130 [Gemmataceae bacterium]